MAALWFLIPPQENDAARNFRRSLREVCRDRGWRFGERRVAEVKDVAGRPLKLLSPRDLNEVYRSVHRQLSAVIDLCGTRVQCDPRDKGRRLSSQRTLRLRSLLRYKAVLFDGNLEPDTSTAAAELADEIAAIEDQTSGDPLPDTDPRSLPFLPFDLGRRRDENLALDTSEGQAAFRGTHGPDRARRDSRGVAWKLDPRAYHGRDALTVRGQVLPTGFHWDVQVDRGSANLCMAAEVWHIKREQYLNVYPDMHTRTTRSGGKKVWP